MPSRRSFLGPVLLLLLGLAAVRAGATPISIAIPGGPVSLPLLVAIDKGLFLAEGLEVVRIPCSSGRACLAALRSGAADVAASAEFAVATTASLKPEVAIVAAIGESTAQIKLVGSRRAGVRASADMAGKHVATVADTSAQYFLDRWLTYQGIDPRHIHLSTAEPGALSELLLKGRAAAVAIWEPEAARIEEQLGDDAVRLPSAHVYTQHFCLAAQANAIELNRPRLEKLLRAMVQAQRFIAQSPDEARAILAASLKVTPAVAQRLMAEQDYRLALHASLPTTMLSQLRWQAAQKRQTERTEPTPAVQQLIDTRLLQSIAPGAVTLAR